MTTVPHELGHRRRMELSLVRDVAASLAITSMWIAVACDAVFGPDIVTSSGASTTRVPSAIVVAAFAWLASAAVARFAFGRRDAGS